MGMGRCRGRWSPGTDLTLCGVPCACGAYFLPEYICGVCTCMNNRTHLLLYTHHSPWAAMMHVNVTCV